jgi:hypothetical protein
MKNNLAIVLILGLWVLLGGAQTVYMYKSNDCVANYTTTIQSSCSKYHYDYFDAVCDGVDSAKVFIYDVEVFCTDSTAPYNSFEVATKCTSFYYDNSEIYVKLTPGSCTSGPSAELSSGAILGIFFGVFFGIFILLVILMLVILACYKKSRNQRPEQHLTTLTGETVIQEEAKFNPYAGYQSSAFPSYQSPQPVVYGNGN